MSEDKIKGSVITNLDQSLQGRAAGVTAVATSGAPGSASSIRDVVRQQLMPAQNLSML